MQPSNSSIINSKFQFKCVSFILTIFLLFFLFRTDLIGGEVKEYVKEVVLSLGKGDKAFSVTQKRWYLENDFVKLGVIDDPGGAVVEFTNKANGVNHVAGDVYRVETDGKVEKKAGWGWIEFMYDTKSDPKEKWMYFQPFKIEFIDGANGEKSIRAIGQTAEQKIERTMTLRPDSPELIIDIKLINISDHERTLWLRWHPQIFPSKDIQGKHGCVLSPGDGDEVRKIRTAWGWDHWFSSKHGFWLCADFKSGDGLFCTFEKEKIPIHFTWTQCKHGRPTSGAVTMEPFPRQQMALPGESIEFIFAYYPFTAKTDPALIPMGVINDKGEQKQAEIFLKRAVPLTHLEKLGGYTYAKTIQFPWGHRRRDKFGLRDWGWADCAIMGYPYQDKPLKIRLTGGAFPEAAKIKGWPKKRGGVCYVIKVVNQDGVVVYENDISPWSFQYCALMPGVAGLDVYDREISVPMNGVPDGTYTLTVAAKDPITKQVFHKYQRQLEMFGKRFKLAEKELSAQLEKDKDRKERPFVHALSKLKGIKISAGKVIIPIGIEDGGNIKRQNFPVILGIPFPEGKFKIDVPVMLLSPQDREVPAQFRVMNVWPDKSLKWLQIDFQADCPANGFDFYKLSVGAKQAAAKSGVSIITDDGDNYIVNTGVMKVIVSKTKLNIPGKVFIDSNKDGEFTDNELVMRNSQSGDIWWEGEEGAIYAMRLVGENSGFFKPGITLEDNGALTAILKLQGWYSDLKNPGKHPAYGEIRLQFFKDKARINVHHQVTFTGSPWVDRLASYGLKLNPQSGIYQSLEFDIDEETIKTSSQGQLYQKSSNRVLLSSDGKTLVRGACSDGAVKMNGKNRGFLFYHENLWQMFPKKLDADTEKGSLVVSYWPKEAGIHTFEPYEEYCIPSSSSAEACGTGASRTQEMVLDFSDSVGVVEARNIFGEPLVACTPPSWIQQTRVVGNLQPYNPKIAPAAEEIMEMYIDFHNRNRKFFKFYGHWDYGTLHNLLNLEDYKWRIIGRYANIGNEEDIVQTPWLLYMRSGDRKYFKFAKLWTRHLMEVQSIRWHNLYPKVAGMSRRHHYTTWLSNGDYGHTMLCQYLEYYHCTGYRPAWDMAKLTAEGMSDTYSGHWRYLSNPIVGSIRMYLETGDEKYKKVADRIWNDLCNWNRNNWWGGTHGARMVRWYAPFNKECMKAWKEWTRTGPPEGSKGYKSAFNTIDSLGELWDMSNDSWFCHRARCSFDFYRSRYSGLNHGTNPIYRGYVPLTMNTQYYMGLIRMLATGKGAVAESMKLFPAGYYGLGQIKKVVIKEEKDKDFKILLSLRADNKIKIIGPDGTAVNFETKEIFSAKGVIPKSKSLFKFVELTVHKDGKTGMYTIKSFYLNHFGCSEAKTVIVIENSLRGSGDTLYVNSDNLGAPEMFVIMNGSPGASLELFTLDGKRLFSETMVRPPCDTVGVEVKQKLPVNTVLRLGDRTGVVFPEVREIHLFPNKNGIFELK